MTTEIAIRQPQAVQLSNEQLKFISTTEFVPKGLRGNLPAILACVATGRELGIGDMAALRSIHIIDGKPTLAAELMVSLVRAQGHSIQGTVSGDRAEVVGKRGDNGDTMNVTWTLEMAAQAGLAGKQNWQKYPSAMLWARAVSQLCRMLFADVFAGTAYTPEELEDVSVEGAESDPYPPGSGVLADDEGPGTEAPVPAPPPDDDEPQVISPAQRTRLWAMAQANGVDEPRLRELVEYVAGVTSTSDIPRSKYDALCAQVEAESLPFA